LSGIATVLQIDYVYKKYALALPCEDGFGTDFVNENPAVKEIIQQNTLEMQLERLRHMDVEINDLEDVHDDLFKALQKAIDDCLWDIERKIQGWRNGL